MLTLMGPQGEARVVQFFLNVQEVQDCYQSKHIRDHNDDFANDVTGVVACFTRVSLSAKMEGISEGSQRL